MRIHSYMACFAALLGMWAYGTQANSAPAAPNLKNAQEKVAMCIGCHAIPGYKTAFPTVYRVPLLGGQNAAYIVKALQAYQTGERKHPSMMAIAASLSDQDMIDLAAYYAAQTSTTLPNSSK